MKRRRSRVWIPMVLAAAYLSLGWLIYQQLISDPDTGALAGGEPGPVPVREVLPPQPEFTMVAIEDFEGVLARPLFSPSRRPPPEEQPELPVTRQEFDYTLKGVLIDIDARIALLDHKGGGGIVRQAEGTEIDGWLVEEVEADYVVVVRGDDERLLELFFHSESSRNARNR